jgi:hypothetical protein
MVRNGGADCASDRSHDGRPAAPLAAPLLLMLVVVLLELLMPGLFLLS